MRRSKLQQKWLVIYNVIEEIQHCDSACCFSMSIVATISFINCGWVMQFLFTLLL